MLECLVMGDSIAVGIGQHLPQCQVVAQIGINSRDFIRKHEIPGDAKLTVISLGTNDSITDLWSDLMRIRMGLRGERVMWVLPSASKKPGQRRIVKVMAYGWDDATIDIPDDLLSRDRIHPTARGYDKLARDIERGM